jgi:flagellar assembly protein FliH
MSKALSITELADMLERVPDIYEPVSFDPALSPEAAGFAEAPGFGGPVSHEPAPASPRHFAPSTEIARALNAMPQPGDADPIRQAWKAGFDDGVATEKRLALEMRGEDIHATAALGDQIRQIGADAVLMLESRMREAVVVLCRQVIDECEVPTERLAARIETAVRMLATAHNAKTIEVSPQDHPLLIGLLPAEWTLAANPALVRGAMRVTTVDGGIEDGPEHWKLALEEAIRTC